MSNEQKKQTIAIFTHVKNEHDFINPWIEYHITLGVNHVYIGIDNSTSIQDEYVLDESLKEKVTFFYIEKMKVKNDMTITNKASEYLKNIKEDWTMILAPDLYYYNNGKNLIDLVNSVKEECGQIILPNIYAFNVYDNKYDNLLENINKYKYKHNPHMINTIVRTREFLNIGTGGHICFLKNKNICKIEGEYKDYTNRFNIPLVREEMLKKTKEYKNIHDYKNGFYLHFHLRNIDEAFIKDYFQWTGEYKFVENINIFKEMITCKDFKNFQNILNSYKEKGVEIKRCRRLLFNSRNSRYFNETLKIPSLKLKNETKQYDKLINIILKSTNISKEEYSEWKKSLIEYLK